MKLLLKSDLTKLLANAKANADSDEGIDSVPVVKFFGGGACTWLISEMDENNIMFGLCDLGFGTPELGDVSYDELKALKFPPFGLPIERDISFKGDKPLSEYASEARIAGYIKT